MIRNRIIIDPLITQFPFNRSLCVASQPESIPANFELYSAVLWRCVVVKHGDDDGGLLVATLTP